MEADTKATTGSSETISDCGGLWILSPILEDYEPSPNMEDDRTTSHEGGRLRYGTSSQ